MLFKRETDLKAAIKREVTAMGGSVIPVENKLDLGTFDLHITVAGRSAWVETKLAGANAAPAVTGPQRGFGYRQTRAGGRAVVLTSTKDGQCRVLRGEADPKEWREAIIAQGPMGRDILEACLG